jgi:hypothetical protein
MFALNINDCTASVKTTLILNLLVYFTFYRSYDSLIVATEPEQAIMMLNIFLFSI